MKVDWNPINNMILSGGEDCKYKVSHLTVFFNYQHINILYITILYKSVTNKMNAVMIWPRFPSSRSRYLLNEMNVCHTRKYVVEFLLLFKTPLTSQILLAAYQVINY